MALHATIFPNGTVRAGSWLIGGGAGSLDAAVADNNDATYAYLLGAATDPVAQFSFDDIPALGASAVVTHLRLRYRASAVGSGLGGTLRLDLLFGGQGITTAIGPVAATIGEADYTLELFAGQPWTAAQINSFVAAISATTGEIRVHRIWIEVHTQTPPTAIWSAGDPVTITSVAGPGEPFRNWAYFDADSDPQQQIHIKLFEGGAAVTDPETEVARLVTDTGAVTFGGTSVGFNVWPNGPYMAAIKASDGKGFGPWNQRAITYDLPVPEAPSLTATPNPTLNRYEVTLDDVAGAYPTEFFQVQRSENSGQTYLLFYGGTNVAFSGTPVTIYDYRSPRMARPYTAASMVAVGYNEPLNYNEPVGYNGILAASASGPLNVVRYRARAGRIYNGVTVWSAWTIITPDNLVGDGTMWLKHPVDPAKSILLQQLANWETTSEEDMSILRAAHRQDFVVFAGVASWKRGELELIFSSDAAYEAFENLRAPKTVVVALDAGAGTGTGAGTGSISPSTPTSYLFQSCFGDTALEQVWMRLGATLSMTRVTTGPQQHANQYRRVKIGFVETKIPT